MSFNWQTEEEWDEMPAKRVVPEGIDKSYINPLIVLLVLTVLLVGVFWEVRSRLSERVVEVDETIGEEVISSTILVRQAFEDQDLELFAALLSGRDTQWSELQQTLFREGVLFERAMMGLVWKPNAGEIVDVQLSPNLTEATVVVNETYVVDIGNGFTQTVQLQHEEVYRQGTTRWLLSEAEVDMNTEEDVPQRFEGRYLQVVYDGAEQGIVEKLAFDLDRKIGELCRREDAGIVCDSDQRVNVEFSRDPSVFSLLQTLTYGQEEEEVLILPSPVILGMPVDQIGYEALYRAYAVPILSSVFVDTIDYVCCDRLVFHQALLDKQLARLGVKPWRVSGQEYDLLAQNGLMVRDMGKFWEYGFANDLEEVDIWQAYVVIDFILYEHPDLSIGELHEGLVVANSYWAWLSPLVGDLDTLDQRWLIFIEDQAMFSESNIR